MTETAGKTSGNILRDIYELPDKNTLGDVTEEELKIILNRNLDAYRAQIRAETLEELAVYCDKHQVGVNPRSGYRIDEFCAPESTHPGMAYAAEFRKMKGSPS